MGSVIKDENTIKKLAYVLAVIALIALFLYLSGCNKEPICGTCRTYEYEYSESGEFRVIKTPTEKLYCGELFKNSLTFDTLEDGFIRNIQKECY